VGLELEFGALLVLALFGFWPTRAELPQILKFEELKKP
jgi:hypothetical protein